MRERVFKRWRRALAIGAGLFTVIAIAHLPVARPLLARLTGRGGGCPFGYDQTPTPEKARASLHAYATMHRGLAMARTRPALGFSLGSEDRTQVAVWTRAHGAVCKDAGGMLSCEISAGVNLDTPAGLKTTALWFRFAPDGTLVSVTALRRTQDANVVAAGFDAERHAVEAAAGPVSREQGSANAEALSAGLLHQASAEFRFRNYYALLRATHMGKDYLLTEEYHALME